MKSRMMIMLVVFVLAVSAGADVIITGIIDGPLSGGTPKAIELYVSGTEDLSEYTMERASNGGDWSTSIPLSGTYTNSFVYLVGSDYSGVDQFVDVFGEGGDFVNIIDESTFASGNGNDAFRLLKDGIIIDQYGNPSDITGGGGDYEAAWCYADSYAYRDNDTGPDEGWIIDNWTIPGNDYLDNLTADDLAIIVPFGTYTNSNDPNIPEPNEPEPVYLTATYNWEDGIGDILYDYGNVYKAENTSEQVQDGSHALRVTVKPIDSDISNKAYIAWVKDLQNGDQVTAKLWAYDDGTFNYQGSRLIADSTSSTDITDFYGYVSGTSTSTSDIGWQPLEYTWTVSVPSEEQNAILIGVQLFNNWYNESETFYFDTFEVIYPEHAEVVLPPAYDPNSYTTHEYGWENFDPYSPDFRETVLLGTYSAIQAGLEISEVRSGNNALWVSDDSDTETAEGYMAWATGLQPGDSITASCFGKSYAGQTDGGVRLWAHYTYDDNDIRSYAGSAGGYEGYSNPGEWVELNKTWVMPDATYTDEQGVEHPVTGMVITVRTYSAPGEGGFVDDLSIELPNYATVTFPSPDGDAICVGGLPSPYDFDGNCKVDLADLVVIMEDWLQCNLQPAEDCGL